MSHVACRMSRLAMPVWPCGSAGLGRVPLRDIVGETTDVIEQLCIEAALERMALTLAFPPSWTQVSP